MKIFNKGQSKKTHSFACKMYNKEKTFLLVDCGLELIDVNSENIKEGKLGDVTCKRCYRTVAKNRMRKIMRAVYLEVTRQTNAGESWLDAGESNQFSLETMSFFYRLSESYEMDTSKFKVLVIKHIALCLRFAINCFD
jgi:hypothetical protein